MNTKADAISVAIGVKFAEYLAASKKKGLWHLLLREAHHDEDGVWHPAVEYAGVRCGKHGVLSEVPISEGETLSEYRVSVANAPVRAVQAGLMNTKYSVDLEKHLYDCRNAVRRYKARYMKKALEELDALGRDNWKVKHLKNLAIRTANQDRGLPYGAALLIRYEHRTSEETLAIISRAFNHPKGRDLWLSRFIESGIKDWPIELAQRGDKESLVSGGFKWTLEELDEAEDMGMGHHSHGGFVWYGDARPPRRNAPN